MSLVLAALVFVSNIVATSTGLTGINWGTAISLSDFQPLVTGIIDLLPTVIGVCIPLIVIRKGWDFLKGNIYSA